MNSTTLITGAGALTATTVSCVDFKEKKVKKDSVKGVAKSGVSTTIASAVTAAVGGSLNAHTMDQIHQKYASAYVESMSDEELERALQQMDLLAESLPEENVKSI